MTVDMTRANYTMPAELALGTIFAEGGGVQLTERWGHLTHRAKDLIEVGERDGYDVESTAVGPLLTARAELQNVIASVRRSPNPEDFSFGVAHLIYRNAPGCDRSYSVENMMACRAFLLDPANSLPMMLDRLQTYWNIERDALKAMFRYNFPAGNGRPASYQGDGGRAIRANYERGLQQARAWLTANP